MLRTAYGFTIFLLVNKKAATYYLSHAYAYYQKRHGNLSWEEFKAVCHLFNQMAMARVIGSSENLGLGAHLGYLSIVRVKRNYTSKNTRNINWPASHRRKEQLLEEGKVPYSKTNAPDGVKWFVYFTGEDYYLRFYWDKYVAQVKNKSVYRFEATRGKVGNLTLLKERIRKEGDQALFSYPLIEPNWKNGKLS